MNKWTEVTRLCSDLQYQSCRHHVLVSKVVGNKWVIPKKLLHFSGGGGGGGEGGGGGGGSGGVSPPGL